MSLIWVRVWPIVSVFKSLPGDSNEQPELRTNDLN